MAFVHSNAVAAFSRVGLASSLPISAVAEALVAADALDMRPEGDPAGQPQPEVDPGRDAGSGDDLRGAERSCAAWFLYCRSRSAPR